jgi:hypothetical protein
VGIPIYAKETINTATVKRCFLYGPQRDLISRRVGAINYTRVEAGSNTSIVTLRVVGGDENGSLKSEIVEYGR